MSDGYRFGLQAARDPVDREQLHKMLDRLLDLRDRTNPATCADPSEISLAATDPPKPALGPPIRGKDNAALMALGLLERLASAAGGWAINHRVGLSLAGKMAGEDRDAHEAERLGQLAADYRSGWLDDPSAARTAMLEVLRAMPLPVPLAVDLREALNALQHGEVMPLVAPAKTRKHGRPYTLAQIRMKAVLRANYLYGKGMRLSAAEATVAGALAVAPLTLKSWETVLLPDVIGKVEVKTAIQEIREAGRLFVELQHDRTKRAEVEAAEGYAIASHLLFLARDMEEMDLAELKAEHEAALRSGMT